MPHLDRHIPELRLAEDRQFSQFVRNVSRQSDSITATIDENLKRKSKFGHTRDSSPWTQKTAVKTPRRAILQLT